MSACALHHDTWVVMWCISTGVWSSSSNAAAGGLVYSDAPFPCMHYQHSHVVALLAIGGWVY